ncbi:MAG TPA: PqqD family protein [Anaeromyxobacteraceae bacterium]|nr:PqqD family protein [Anaeromyxobacteraceae bacterium]
MSLTLEGRVARTRKAAWQQIEHEVVLLVGEEERLLGLNAVAGRIWELADGSRSVGEIAAAIAVEFDADPADVDSDALAFVRVLVGRGLLEVREGDR